MAQLNKESWTDKSVTRMDVDDDGSEATSAVAGGAAAGPAADKESTEGKKKAKDLLLKHLSKWPTHEMQ